jgi:[ribosomal protein S18]-alanine N-acetyltransferase
MDQIIIRDYLPEDYPFIEALWHETGLGGATRGDNQQIIESSLDMGGKLLVAQTIEGKLIATSWMTFDGRRLHLHHFAVNPWYQRRGIGRRLARESINFAMNKGFQIKLEVHKSNTIAIEMYKNLGFQYLGDYDVYIIRTFKQGHDEK